MAVYAKKEPWVAITKAVAMAKGQTLAAIGYVSEGAIDYLPLKKGDVLVCDASTGSIRNGSTNPQALLPFLNRGVKVFSKQGLHAKVVITRRRAFVGSANASSNSALRLFEATLDTTNSVEIAELRSFVHEMMHTPLTKSDVQKLVPLVPKRQRHLIAAVDPMTLPDSVNSIVLVDLTNGKWTPQEDRAHKNGNTTARREARRIVSAYKIEEFALSRTDTSRLKVGDWVIQIIDDEPQVPGWVVHTQTFGARGVTWLAVPKNHSPLENVLDLGLKRKWTHEEIRRIRGSDATRLVQLFV